MKQLLIISPFFPPIGGSGVYRITRLVKHLPDYGWQPIVLCMDQFRGGPRDESLLDDLPPGLVVRRVPYYEPTLRAFRARKKANLPNPNPASADAPAPSPSGSFKTFLARLRYELLIPDLTVTWLPFAFQAARQLLAQFPIQAVLSTSVPYTSHLVGWRCAARARVPWIADYGDLWTLAEWEKIRSPFTAALTRRLEQGVLRRADYVLTYSQGMREILLQAFPDLPQEKISTLPAAVDLEKFQAIPDQEGYPLVYTGVLTDRYPLGFIEAVAELNRRQENQGRAPLTCAIAGHLGHLPAGLRAKFEARSAAGIKALGYVPHARAISLVKSARVLILSLPLQDSAFWVPGKIAEYLASGNPIVAIVPPGETADLLRQSGRAWIVADNPTEIAEALERALAHPRLSAPSLPELMTARGQARFVAELADRLIANQ